MYTALLVISFAISIYLIVRIVNNLFDCSVIWKSLLVIFLYFTYNTISGLSGYYLGGKNLERNFFLLGSYIFILLLCVVFYRTRCTGKVEIITSELQERIWLICFLVLFAVLFCSTSFQFVPVWGNVDEAVHFEVSAQYRNILDNGTNPFYQDLSSLVPTLNRYSYLWGYHYNCAVISKILNLDVIYVNHFIKCFSLACFVTLPMLWFKSGKKYSVAVQITYFIAMIICAGNWYMFFSFGFTAQIFSLAVCYLVIGLASQSKWEKNKVYELVIIPQLMLFCLISYMLTGAILLIFLIYMFALRKQIRSISVLLLYCLYIVPTPPIWNQLKFFILGQGTADEALTASSALKEPPSVLWLIVGAFLLSVFIYKICLKKNENILWQGYVIIETMIFAALFFLYDNKGYIIYKIMITLFPLYILFLGHTVAYIGEKIKINSIFKITGSFIIVFLLGFLLYNEGVISISTVDIKYLFRAKPQVTIHEWNCLKEIETYDKNTYDGVEYIGMNGPSARIGYVFLKKIPYSWTEEGTGWSFRSDYMIEDIIAGIGERILRGEEPRCVYALINEDRVIDIEKLDEYSNIFSSEKEVYRSGNCSVHKLVFRDHLSYEQYNCDELSGNPDFKAQKVMFYNDVYLVSELDRQINYRINFNNKKNISMIDIQGRSIHGSSFIIRLYNDGEIAYEEDISGFEYSKCITLQDGFEYDTFEIEVTGKNISDSIIVGDIGFYSFSAD